jgi:hypothetical protein
VVSGERIEERPIGLAVKSSRVREMKRGALIFPLQIRDLTFAEADKFSYWRVHRRGDPLPRNLEGSRRFPQASLYDVGAVP